jgi:hypothetical protein
MGLKSNVSFFRPARHASPRPPLPIGYISNAWRPVTKYRYVLRRPAPQLQELFPATKKAHKFLFQKMTSF